MSCTAPKTLRYARQLALAGLGERGQDALGAAAVRIVGDGPAAATAARYLVGAGVGACATDALPLDSLDALNPDPALTRANAAPIGSHEVDPGALAAILGSEVTGDGPALPELLGALAAADALVALLAE